MPVEITTHLIGKIAVITPRVPNLDAAISRVLLDQIRQRPACRGVVLDLSIIQFADSAGLGLLCRLHRELGSSLVIVISNRLAPGLQKLPANRLPNCVNALHQALDTFPALETTPSLSLVG